MTAILTSTVVGYVCVIAAYLWPKTVFMFLLNSSGAIALFVYLLIAMSQLRMRRQIEANAPETLRVKMWFFPWLTYATILGIGVVVASMFVLAQARSQAVLSSLAWIVTVAAYAVFRKRMAAGRAAVPVATDPTAPGEVEIAEVETALAPVPEQRTPGHGIPHRVATELAPVAEATR